MNFFQRKIAVDSKYQRATSVVFNIYGAIVTLAIFIFTGSFKHIILPTSPFAWIFMLSAAIFYALYERGRFTAAKLLDASTLTIVSNISLVVAFIGAVFLYSEALTISKILGAVFIIFALTIVSIQKNIHKKVSLKGVFVALFIFTLLGLGWMLDKKGATFFTAGTYNILLWTVPLIFIYLPYVKTKEIIYEAKHSSKGLFIMAALNVTGYYLQLQALQIADATRVIPVVQLSTLTTVIMGVLILKEKEFLWRKLFAAVIAIAGVYLLTVG